MSDDHDSSTAAFSKLSINESHIQTIISSKEKDTHLTKPTSSVERCTIYKDKCRDSSPEEELEEWEIDLSKSKPTTTTTTTTTTKISNSTRTIKITGLEESLSLKETRSILTSLLKDFPDTPNYTLTRESKTSVILHTATNYKGKVVNIYLYLYLYFFLFFYLFFYFFFFFFFCV